VLEGAVALLFWSCVKVALLGVSYEAPLLAAAGVGGNI